MEQVAMLFLLLFIVLVVYMLWIMVCTLQSLDSAWCWSIGPLHGFLMYCFWGSANGEYKQGAFDDGKPSFEIRTKVVFFKMCFECFSTCFRGRCVVFE
jgi:hypothetical protein